MREPADRACRFGAVAAGSRSGALTRQMREGGYDMKHRVVNSGELEIRFPDPHLAARPRDGEDDILDQFVSEAASSLEELEGATLRIESDETRDEALRTVRHILHNLKGESGMMDMPLFSDVCHQAESVLDEHESRGVCPTDFLLGVKDWLQTAIQCIASGQACGSPDAHPYPQVRVDQAPRHEGLRTLIVEDDFTSRLLLQELLKGYGPSHVAVNGREAVEAVRAALEAQDPYDLICLDIMMPEMDGQQALREIRNLEEARGVMPSNRARVVMTTALSDLKNVSNAYHSLCDAYLTKPIEKVRLLEELRRQDLIP